MRIMSTKGKGQRREPRYGVAVELGSANPKVKIVDMRTMRRVSTGLVMEVGAEPFLYDKKADRVIPLDEKTHRAIVDAARKAG